MKRTETIKVTDARHKRGLCWHCPRCYMCTSNYLARRITQINKPAPALTYKLDMLRFPDPQLSETQPLKTFVCFFIKLIYSSLETDLAAVLLQEFVCEGDEMLMNPACIYCIHLSCVYYIEFSIYLYCLYCIGGFCNTWFNQWRI